MTDNDTTETNSIDADSLRESLPTDGVRDALETDDIAGLEADELEARLQSFLGGRPPASGLLLAGLGFDGLVYAVSRYVPEYFRVLGAGPLVIGLFGTVALAIGPLYTALWPRRDVAVPAVTTALAAAGLLTWLLAPQFTTVSNPPAWVMLFCGLLLVGVLTVGRDDSSLAPTPDPLGVTAGRDDKRGGLAAAGGLALLVALLLVAASVRAALAVALTLGTVLGAVVAVLRFVDGRAGSTGDPDPPANDDADADPPANDDADADADPPADDDADPDGEASRGDVTASGDAADQSADDATGANDGGRAADDTDSRDHHGRSDDGAVDGATGGLPDLRAVLSAVADLPSGVRSLLFGETLVRAAIGAVSVFVIVVVTSVLGLRTQVLGWTVGPSAVFGGLVVVELGAAAGATAVVERVDGLAGRDTLVVVGATLAAAFPLLLMSVPPDPSIVACLFTLYGLRAVGGRARRELVDDALGTVPVDADDYRTVRDLLVAPSALAGGLLFVLSPMLAFGTATVVGALGVRELWRFVLDPATAVRKTGP